MPQRVTSRGLGYGGAALVLVSGVLIVSPVLWGRPDLANRLVADNAELDRISRSVNGIRDVLDALREAQSAERAYLLTASQTERAVYHNVVQTVHKSMSDLHTSAADPGTGPRFDALVDRLLSDLARSAAFEDDRRHDEAVAASDIATGRDLFLGIHSLTRERIDALRGRYLKIVDEIRITGERSDQSARAMFGLAGASFALGCIALVTYLRRHLTAEAELRLGRDAALEASLMKSRFVATASHDLRQPLHAISMFVGVLRRRSRDPAVLEVVENVATAVASMQRMFAALLDVARLDAGAVQVEYRTVALQELFNALEVEFAASAVAKGLSLQIQPSTLSVTTDSGLLETILRNLLSNAVKFTDRGRVGITTVRRGEVVDIAVFDTGIGIAAEDLSMIFGQFERLSQHAGSHEGLGLGLSIVQRMADLLGVKVSLESQPGNGSCLTLSLPFAHPAQAMPMEPTPRERALSGHRILVLEDHPEARKAIALAIETLGAVPIEATSAEEAFSLLAEMEPEMPCAAVIDHDIGGRQTGPGFLDAYAAHRGHALPAVIITGSTDASTLASVAASGRPWLIKPVDLDTLCLTLSRLVSSTATS
jgi:signal transduction histidine kinase/ActR/RegA family two-component response regulator